MNRTDSDDLSRGTNMRTYDFSIAVDLRYHYVFADFDFNGDDGAHGLSVTFGIGR